MLQCSLNASYFRYMMVDSADDQKTHRPAPPKEVRSAVPLYQQFERPLATRFKNSDCKSRKQQGRTKQEHSQSPLVSEEGRVA